MAVSPAWATAHDDLVANTGAAQAPELNPAEKVWSAMKRSVAGQLKSPDADIAEYQMSDHSK